MAVRNLFTDIPAELAEELTEVLASDSAVRIERIVSRGHCSPADFWYDQDESEWVLVVQGRARLQFADRAQPIELAAGDCVRIPAHQRHRVAWTDPRTDTIWLAVFSGAGDPSTDRGDP